MDQSLSPQAEQYIAEALSTGEFSSRTSFIEAAIADFHAARVEEEERLRLCDQAIDELDAGLGIEATPEYWENLKRRVREAAEAAKLSAKK